MRAARYDVAGRDPGVGTTSFGVADWLCLAAAPTFAIMAILSAAFGGELGRLCTAMGSTMSLDGMVVMYGLMSAFHLGPWLRLLARA